MPRHLAITTAFLVTACFADPETTSGDGTSAASSATNSMSTSSGMTPVTTADDDASSGQTVASSSGVDDSSSASGQSATGVDETTGALPGTTECEQYCAGCFSAADYDACYDTCISTHDALVADTGTACGEAWLAYRACVGTDPDCDLSPDTQGPCRFHARNHIAICDGIVSGNCGIHVAPPNSFHACDGDRPEAGTCPDDVDYENVGVEPLDCGSLRPFEGCCSPSGDYFYCEPQGGGMTYEECPPA